MKKLDIDEYGGGLTVVIRCKNRLVDDWMAFASWCSLKRSLPDAKIVVACERGKHDMLKWCFRLGVPYVYHADFCRRASVKDVIKKSKEVSGAVLWMTPDMTCHEPLSPRMLQLIASEEEWAGEFCLPAKSEEIGVFCTINDGCGSFVLERWIDKAVHPMGGADRLRKGHLTTNERRVFALWKKVAALYDFIG